MADEQDNERVTIFGIDLGTTYSCIAYVDQYGKATVVANSEGDLTTPSVVDFEPDVRIVGKEAKNLAVAQPNNVVSMIKREMGTNFTFPYDGVQYSPQEISASILRKVAKDAEEQTGIPVKDVVITHPAYFGDAERNATREAGIIAGLNVRGLINEPTAAALDFGIQDGRDQVAMVYDLGGGTFDATIIKITGGNLELIATGGDHRLGGHDWDEQVVKYVAQQWQEKHADLSDPLDSLETLQDLWGKVENAKRALTAREETRVAVVHEGQSESVILTRAKFDELTQSQLEQTIMYTNQTLKVAEEKGVGKIDILLLVGGSTRMPQVKARLQSEFPGIEIKTHDPDQAVAKGAALYGLKLAIGSVIAGLTGDVSGAQDPAVPAPASPEAIEEVVRLLGLPASSVKALHETTICMIASHSYGIMAKRAGKDIIANLVISQDRIPVQDQRTFGTLEDDQAEATLIVLQNDIRERSVDDPTVGREIARASLELPPNLLAGSPIEVTYTFDAEGLLLITAREGTRNRTINVEVRPEGGLTMQEMADARARSTSLVVS